MDGTFIEAWASLKSFRPRKDLRRLPVPPAETRRWIFTGKTRMNETHASTTDPEARLARKGKGKEAKLCYMGHVLMENRHGLIRTPRLTAATGTAERDTAADMVEDLPGRHRITVGADKAYDTREFIQSLRALKAVPHVAQNLRDAPRPSTAAPPAIRATLPVNACANGWRKSSAGSRPWAISGKHVTRHRTGGLDVHPHRRGLQPGAHAHPDGRSFSLSHRGLRE